jgi:large subunit ribosomal protein L24
MKRLKIGDQVKIITGKKKGQIGIISALFPKKSLVSIEGIYLLKMSKDKLGENQQEKKIPILLHSSNLMLWNLNEGGRIGFKYVENEKKRFFKKSGNII